MLHSRGSVHQQDMRHVLESKTPYTLMLLRCRGYSSAQWPAPRIGQILESPQCAPNIWQNPSNMFDLLRHIEMSQMGFVFSAPRVFLHLFLLLIRSFIIIPE